MLLSSERLLSANLFGLGVGGRVNKEEEEGTELERGEKNYL